MKTHSNTIIKSDQTDHFAFYCELCNSFMVIYKIHVNDNYSGERILFLFLKCKKCNRIDMKKAYRDTDEGIIWLEERT